MTLVFKGRAKGDGPHPTGVQVPALVCQPSGGHGMGGVLKGRPIFLLCGGPSLGLLTEAQKALLEGGRGVVTMAVNNAWSVVRPNYWVCNDSPAKFLDVRWRDPGIVKFVPERFFNEELVSVAPEGHLIGNGRKVKEMPNVWGFKRRNQFEVSRFLGDTQVNWGNTKKGEPDSLGIENNRSTMLSAVQLCYWLGAHHVFLIGADLRCPESMENFYGFGEKKTEGHRLGSARQFEALETRLVATQEWARRTKIPFTLWNVGPEGAGVSAFPRKSVDAALAQVLKWCEGPLDAEGWYDGGPKALNFRKVRHASK